MTLADEFLAELRAGKQQQASQQAQQLSPADSFLAELRGADFTPSSQTIDDVLSVTTQGGPDQPAGEYQAPTHEELFVGGLETLAATTIGGMAGLYGHLGGLVEGAVKEYEEGGFSLDPEKQMAAAERIQQLAGERAALFAQPFMPESEVGQELTANLEELVSQLPVVPQLAIEGQILRQMGRTGLNIAPAKSAQIAKEMHTAAQAVREKARIKNQQAAQAPLGSVGAQALSDARVRVERAKSLSVPIDLTRGQATKTLGEQRFEGETAKIADVGAPLRDHFNEQNSQLIQNFDAFIDETGAELYYPVEVGEVVEKAIRADAAKHKSKIRKLYKEAERTGGTKKEVDLNALSEYLNDHRAERAENSIMTKLQRQFDVLEVGEGSFTDGSLSLKDMTLNQAEAVRRFINRNVIDSDSNDVRIASDLKNLIDASTEGLGSEKYKAARKARLEYAEKFENVGLINNILSTKRGTKDRIIALEDVTRKAVLTPSTSTESLKHLRRTLQNAGGEGKQAWSELQAATVRHLQDAMTRNVARNERGDPVVSPAGLDRELQKLDRAGKLDVLFGKKGAEQLRLINEVVKDVAVNVPNAVNTSNTATVLAAMVETVATGAFTGLPMPVFSSLNTLKNFVKDKKLAKKVDKALNYDPTDTE